MLVTFPVPSAASLECSVLPATLEPKSLLPFWKGGPAELSKPSALQAWEEGPHRFLAPYRLRKGSWYLLPGSGVVSGVVEVETYHFIAFLFFPFSGTGV
jgi:hypothetical protein